jgi:aquaporin Z
MEPTNRQILAAELIGTAVLVMGGIGTAVLHTTGDLSVGTLGVALAFGLSLLVMVYAIGSISGCHINPAVTVGLWANGSTPASKVPWYIGGQLIGAAVGGLVIFAIANGVDGFDSTNNFAQNGWGDFSPGGYNLMATAVVEVVFTAVLVFVVLGTTHPKFPAAGAGLSIGLALGTIHLISIPVDNTSVNPARSFAAAIFAGADAWKQLWAFIVFPVVGGLVGFAAWRAVFSPSSEPPG